MSGFVDVERDAARGEGGVPSPPPGQTNEAVLLEHGYALEERLAKGGFAVVYKARRVSAAAAAAGMPSVIAVKVLKLRREPAADDELLEAKIMRQVRHDSVVACYDHFKAAGRDFLLLEFVNGGALFDKIPAEVGVDEPQVKVWMRQIVAAVDFIHGQNIVHRDLKPDNILITESGVVKLADFGLSEDVTDDAHSTNVVGTTGFMAPEVRVEYKMRPFDARKVDVFAVGITAYHLLTGRELRAHEPLSHLDDKPLAKAFVERALAADPVDRPSAHQLASDAWLLTD